MDAVQYAREQKSKVMDAIKFIEERNRMCKSFISLECNGRHAFNAYELSCAVDQESTMDATDQIAIVEKWSAKHPHKIRQDVFLKQWPGAKIASDGILTICPLTVSSTHIKEDGSCRTWGRPCTDCRSEFWMQEVE